MSGGLTAGIVAGRMNGTTRNTEPTAVGDGVEIREGRHGRGVYATRAFAEGDVVEHCPVLELPGADVSGRLSDYVFKSTEGDDEVLLVLGFGMLYNHGAEPNVDYAQETPRTMTFYTLRDVAAGEQLVIDYGEEWWDTRGLKPDDD